MSAALDSGLAIGVVIIFFGFLYPGVTKNFHWWGTEIYKQVSKVYNSTHIDYDLTLFRVATGQLVPTLKYLRVGSLGPIPRNNALQRLQKSTNYEMN